MDIVELGLAFRAARITRRLTQHDAARHAGISVATISRLERGDLLEIGVMKLISLFGLVGMDLTTRPKGHTRTLDDIQRAYSAENSPKGANNEITNSNAVLQSQQRVRRTKAESIADATLNAQAIR
jgi:transcriptional regulator with XRE-family HTH domain